MAYILIVVWHVGYGGTAIHTQEFRSKATCEFALKAIGDELVSKWNNMPPISVCVPK